MSEPESNVERGAIALAIRRPVGVVVGVALVVLFGFLALRGIPIQLTPDIEVPTLSVTTDWPGSAPAEVEREILEEQEEVLKSLQGLERMTSEARAGQGSVTLELNVGTDLDEAIVRVLNRLSQVPQYPATARQPVVSTARNTGPPLAVVLLQSETKGAVGPYRTWVEQEILPQLERIKGVAKVDLFGGQESEVVVTFDPRELASRGITLDVLTAAIRAELRDVSGGDVDLGKRSYTVRTLATPDEIEGLESVVLRVGQDGEKSVLLSDIGSVDIGLRKRTAFVFGDDHESLALLFRREAGSNVLEVTEQIRATVDMVQERYLSPLGLSIRVAADQVDYINGALGLVQQNLIIGGVLAVIVLLLFLRSVRAAAVVGLAIPVCVIGTALGMSLLGRTVNVVSLAGMAFAVGMVVDNAIVVLENIDTWRRRGVPVAQAALEGTREVWGAILASTLTTAAVFIPIIAWQDEVGELLRDVAVAVTVAVFLSLLVSVLVIPSFSAKILRTRTPGRGPLARAGAFMRGSIGGVVRWWTASFWRNTLVAVTVPALAAVVAFALLPPLEYLPTGQRNLLFGILVPPPGYSVSEMTDIGRAFQADVSRHIEVDTDGVPAVERSFFVARPGQAFMGASTVDPNRIGELVDFYKKRQRQIPGTFGIATQASLFGRGIGSARAVEVEITGPDIAALVGLGGQMMGQLKGLMPDAQIRPIPSLDLGAPELRVVPDRKQAAAHGLGGGTIGAMVDALVDGRIIGELGREGEPQLDVVIRANGQGVHDRQQLLAAPVATPMGRVVPLGTLARVDDTVGPATINRIERRRSITLQVSPPDDIALEDTVDLIRDEVVGPLEARGLPDGVRIELAGTAGKLTEARGRMLGVLGLALIISFALLAALFEDFLAPIVVLVTIPLAAAGGVVGLRLVDATLGSQPLDMMTAMGFVILIGVVVNNAILVVDGALARLRGGMDLPRSLGEAVSRRVRPIFMSTLTSLAGLLPLVLFPGSGSELYRGVGAVVLGGLALSTVLTLFVVPALFAMVWKLARRA